MNNKLIRVSHVYPPIPTRNFDWCAYFDGEEEHGCYGWGPTQQAAIADLMEEAAIADIMDGVS